MSSSRYTLYRLKVGTKMWGSDLTSLTLLLQDLEEQRNLLSEAARALQSQEEKHQERMTRAQQQLAEEQVGHSNFATALVASLHKLIVGQEKGS